MLRRAHMVHVDDVARAHIFLLEHPNPKGRYNCSPFIIKIEEISKLLSARYPEFQIPSKEWVLIYAIYAYMCDYYYLWFTNKDIAYDF